MEDTVHNGCCATIHGFPSTPPLPPPQKKTLPKKKRKNCNLSMCDTPFKKKNLCHGFKIRHQSVRLIALHLTLCAIGSFKVQK